uniref:GPI-anchor transamidase n=1 Tax=Ciona savignyi TaxID=51511 RepID=H2Y7I1_CIOSA
MTGHGGEDFLKFQDAEEVSNVELADAFEQMWQKRRYNELLFIIDTCQAVSMFSRFYSPNLMAIASSQIGEDSLSHHVDPAIGVYIIDRYTYHLLEFLERVKPGSSKTMDQLLKVCPPHHCISTPGFSTHLFARSTDRTLISDFFGSVRTVDLSDDVVRWTARNTSRGNSPEIDETSEKSNFASVDQFLTEIPTAEKSKHPMSETASLALLFVVVSLTIKTFCDFR